MDRFPSPAALPHHLLSAAMSGAEPWKTIPIAGFKIKAKKQITATAKLVIVRRGVMWILEADAAGNKERGFPRSLVGRDEQQALCPVLASSPHTHTHPTEHTLTHPQ